MSERSDVPEADLLAQQEPVDPDVGEEELPELDPEFPAEADPADILEQNQSLSGEDDYPRTDEGEQG